MAKKGSQLTVRTATEIQGGEFVILGYAGRSYQMTLDELKKFIGIIEADGGSVDLTQVSTDILPLADASKDIGSLEKRWKKVYSTALTVKAQSVDEEEVNIHDGGIEGILGRDIQWSIDGSGNATFLSLKVNGADVATMQYVNNELSKYVTTDTLTKNYVSNTSLTEILKKYYESGYVDYLLSSKASTSDLNKTNTQLGLVRADVATLKSYFQDTDDVDDIINKWRELEAFLAGQTETSTLADLLSVKADRTELEQAVSDMEQMDARLSGLIGTKQNAISDLATIRSNATNGNTAYGWGDHSKAGYAMASSLTATQEEVRGYSAIISELQGTVKLKADKSSVDSLAEAIEAINEGITNLTTDNIAESSNKYFTNARAVAALSDTLKGYVTTLAFQDYAVLIQQNSTNITNLTKTVDKIYKEYVTWDNIPTKTSQLTNDSEFLTSQSLDGLLEDYAKKSGYSALKVLATDSSGNIVAHYVSTDKLGFLSNVTSDIQAQINAISIPSLDGYVTTDTLTESLNNLSNTYLSFRDGGTVSGATTFSGGLSVQNSLTLLGVNVAAGSSGLTFGGKIPMYSGDAYTKSEADKKFHPLTTVDTTPTSSSTNLITSGGVFKMVADLDESISSNFLLKTTAASTYLPLDGGTMNNYLAIQLSSGDNPLYLHSSAADASGACRIYFEDGSNAFQGYVMTGWGNLILAHRSHRQIGVGDSGIWCSTDNGTTKNTLIHTGNIGSYALPLSGGTITGYTTIKASGTLFVLRNSEGTMPYMNFRSDIDGVNTDLGDLGVDPTDKNLKYYNKGAWNTLIHSGNISSYAVTSTTLNDFPRLNGTSPSGASATGTWGIDISGSASYATNAGRAARVIGTATGNYISVDGGNWGSTEVLSNKYNKTYGDYLYLGVAGMASNNASLLLLQNGNVVTSGSIYLPNNSDLAWENSDGTVNYIAMYVSDTNNLIIGNDIASAGYDTYLSGNNIRLRYGTSRNIGVYLNSSGNVGIGTTDPQYKLEVNGEFFAAGKYTSTIGGPAVRWGTSAQYYVGSNGADNFYLWTDESSDLRFGTNGLERVRINSSGNVTIGGSDLAGTNYKLYVDSGSSFLTCYDRSYIDIGPSSTTFGLRFTILGNGNTFIQSRRFDNTTAYYNIILQELGGNVLIGTTSGVERSTAKLQIYDTNNEWASINYTDNAVVYCAHKNGYGMLIASKSNNMGKYLLNIKYNDGLLTGAGSAALIVLDNGNVGIGTTNPNTKLHVVGGANIEGALSSYGITATTTAATDAAFTHYVGSTKLWWVSSYNNCANFHTALYVQSGSTPFKVATVNDLSSYLKKEGGTISGSLTFSATSGSHIMGNSNSEIIFQPSSDTSGANIPLKIAKTGSSTYTMYCDESEVYDLGTSSYKWNILYCRSASQSSDATLKNILGNVALTTSQIANAPAVNFTWKNGGAKDVGTIAQYWKNVLPEVVSGDEGSYGMNYAVLGVVSSIILARNIETHEQRIARLEKEKTEMKAEAVALKAEIVALKAVIENLKQSA